MDRTGAHKMDDLLLNPAEVVGRAVARLEEAGTKEGSPAVAEEPRKAMPQVLDLSPVPVVELPMVHTTSEARKLEAAGWKPKERCDLTIWERPDNGFYVSEEIALHMLNQGKGGKA